MSTKLRRAPGYIFVVIAAILSTILIRSLAMPAEAANQPPRPTEATNQPQLIMSAEAANQPPLIAVLEGKSVFYSVSLRSDAAVQIAVADPNGTILGMSTPQQIAGSGLVGQLSVPDQISANKVEVKVTTLQGKTLTSLWLFNICDAVSPKTLSMVAMPGYDIAAQFDSFGDINFRWTSQTASQYQVVVYDRQGTIVGATTPTSEAAQINKVKLTEKPADGALIVSLRDVNRKMSVAQRIMPMSCAANMFANSAPNFSVTGFVGPDGKLYYQVTGTKGSLVQLIVRDANGNPIVIGAPQLLTTVSLFGTLPIPASVALPQISLSAFGIADKNAFTIDAALSTTPINGIAPDGLGLNARLTLAEPNLIRFSLTGNVATPIQLVITNQDGVIVGFSALYPKINGQVDGQIKLFGTLKEGDVLKANVATAINPQSGQTDAGTLTISASILDAAKAAVNVNANVNTGGTGGSGGGTGVNVNANVDTSSSGTGANVNANVNTGGTGGTGANVNANVNTGGTGGSSGGTGVNVNANVDTNGSSATGVNVNGSVTVPTGK